MSTPTAIYVRISRDTEGMGLGVKRQRGDCEALATKLGWTVVETYEDNDVSATRSKPRPAYQRMMADVERGKVQAVVVWDVDRLTRTPRELEDVIDHADRIGLRLASVGGDIDLATEQGRMMARMKGTVARYEIEQSRRRLKAKHKELAASGAHVGPRPFGWDFDADRALVINPAEAATVRECVDRVLAGDGIWKVTRDLNDQGVLTSTGRQWQTQVLRRMLLRWRNCGVRTHLGKEAGQGQWDPIVDRETHERVVALLTDPARRSNNRGTEPKYLLTSVAYCGECGGHVVGTNEFTYAVKGGLRTDGTRGPSRTRVYAHAYKCPNADCLKVQRNMADVDEHVTRVVLGVLERDGVRLLGGDPVAAEAARERISALDAKLALTADQFADDVITGDQLKRITERLRPQLAAERARLSQAQPEASLAEYTGPGVASAWDAADVETRKRLLRLLGMKITIERVGSGNGRSYDPDSVTIEWAGA
ncbi:MAG: recombinase family protein [Nocardioides sp.]|nr:recombinase family protein [Nocardioides sp.]